MNDILIVGNGAVAERLAERMRHLGHRGHCGYLGHLGHLGHEGTLNTLVTEPQISGRRPPPLTTVTALDREQRRVRALVNGAETSYPYDTLVLAQEARPVVPAIPGLADAEGRLAEGVVAMGTACDSARITGDTVVVLGESALAVETAGTLAARGVHTTLVCPSPLPLYTRLGETCSAMLSEQLEQAGVSVIGGRTVVRRAPGRLRLDDGTALRADTLVLCTGAVPDTRLALDAGLDVRTGVVVDDQLRTSDPRIHAIGECAEYEGQVTTGPSAVWEQAETLAEILAGRPAVHRPHPSSFRLRSGVADVSAIGSLADLHRPGTRLISLTDRANRRYGRLALRDERVVAAVLFGLPQAIATIGLLHRRGQRLPSDRLGMLLDLPPRPASHSTEANENAPVCLCNSVSKQALRQAWLAGSRTVAALAEATRATTGCGGCSRSVEELSGVWAREMRTERKKAS